MKSGIDYFSRGNPFRGTASKMSLSMRQKMFDFFMEIFIPDETVNILDVGVTPDNALPESNFLERWYPYPWKIVATSIEDVSGLKSIFKDVSFIQTEKKVLPFKDKSFDIVFCSAVLEHVGTRRDQNTFVSELLRVGHYFFLLTPNRLFPVEFHTFIPFIHWLPQKIHQHILQKMGIDFWAKTENLNLVSEKSLKGLFPEYEQLYIKRFRLMGITSNLVAYGQSSS